MPSINYSNARQNFKELISKVNEDSVTYTITTKEDKNAVILAEKDYNAILETMYLQSNPANVSHLNKSIQELNQTIRLQLRLMIMSKLNVTFTTQAFKDYQFWQQHNLGTVSYTHLTLPTNREV